MGLQSIRAPHNVGVDGCVIANALTEIAPYKPAYEN
jgi:hypothetical protein